MMASIAAPDPSSAAPLPSLKHQSSLIYFIQRPTTQINGLELETFFETGRRGAGTRHREKMDQIQFIVARLNDPPFRKKLSLVDFDDKSPGTRRKGCR